MQAPSNSNVVVATFNTVQWSAVYCMSSWMVCIKHSILYYQARRSIAIRCRCALHPNVFFILLDSIYGFPIRLKMSTFSTYFDLPRAQFHSIE